MPLTLAHISYALLGRNAAVPKRTRELMEMQGMTQHAAAQKARRWPPKHGGECKRRRSEERTARKMRKELEAALHIV